jgi:hypothetical protein
VDYQQVEALKKLLEGVAYQLEPSAAEWLTDILQTKESLMKAYERSDVLSSFQNIVVQALDEKLSNVSVSFKNSVSSALESLTASAVASEFSDLGKQVADNISLDSLAETISSKLDITELEKPLLDGLIQSNLSAEIATSLESSNKLAANIAQDIDIQPLLGRFESLSNNLESSLKQSRSVSNELLMNLGTLTSVEKDAEREITAGLQATISALSGFSNESENLVSTLAENFAKFQKSIQDTTNEMISLIKESVNTWVNVGSSASNTAVQADFKAAQLDSVADKVSNALSNMDDFVTATWKASGMLSSAFNLQEYIATLFKAVSEQFGSMQNDFSLFKQWMVNSLSQTDASTQAVLKSLADYRAALRDAIASKEKLANEQLQLQKQQNEFNQKAVCEKESRDTLQFALNALALINDARDVSTNAERLEEEKRARRERFRA